MDEKTDDDSVESMVQKPGVTEDSEADLSVHDDTEKITLKETEMVHDDSVESMVQKQPVSGDSQADLPLEADTEKITVKEIDQKTYDDSVESVVQKLAVSEDSEAGLLVHDDTEKITLKVTEKIDDDSVESMVQNPPVSSDSQADLSLEADTEKITLKEIDQKTDDDSVESMVQKPGVTEDSEADVSVHDDTEKITLKETEKIDDDSFESMVQNPPVSSDSQTDLSLEADTEKITVKEMEKIDDDSVESMFQKPPVSVDSQADLSLEADTEKITVKEAKCTYVRVNNLPAAVKIVPLKMLFPKAVNIEIQNEKWQATLLFYDLSDVERDELKKKELMLKESNVTVDIHDKDDENCTRVRINNLPKDVNWVLLRLWFPMANLEKCKGESRCAILTFTELSYAKECLIKRSGLVLKSNKLTLEILDDNHDKVLMTSAPVQEVKEPEQKQVDAAVMQQETQDLSCDPEEIALQAKNGDDQQNDQPDGKKELKHTLRYVCVNNLPANVDIELLNLLFPKAEDREIQENKNGCAILTFPDNASAKQCVMEQRNLKIENKQLTMYILNHQQIVAKKKKIDKRQCTGSHNLVIPKRASTQVQRSITEINRMFDVKVSMSKNLKIMRLGDYSDTAVNLAALVMKYIYVNKHKGSLIAYILRHHRQKSVRLLQKKKPLPLVAQIQQPQLPVHPTRQPPPLVHPTRPALLLVHPTCQSPPLEHPTCQSPPLVQPTHQSPPLVRPTHRRRPRVRPTRRQQPLVHPTLQSPPLAHPAHQSLPLVYPTRQPLLDTPPFHQPPDVYLRPQHQPFMHMAPEIYQPPIHMPPFEQAPVHLPEDYHQLLQSQAPRSSSSQRSLHEEMRKQITNEILAKLAPLNEVPTRSNYDDMETHITANVMARMTELISQEVVSSNMETSASKRRNDSHDTRGQHRGRYAREGSYDRRQDRGDPEYQTVKLSPKRRRYDEDSAVHDQDLRELLEEKRRPRIRRHHSLREKELREETRKRPRFDDHERGVRRESWREEERIHQGYHTMWKKDVVKEGDFNKASSDLQSPEPRPPPMMSAPLVPAVPHPQPAMSTHGNVPYLDMTVYHPRLAAPPITPRQGMYGIHPAPAIPHPQSIYGIRPAPPIPPQQGMYGIRPTPPIPSPQGMYGVKPAPPIPPQQGMYGIKPAPPIPPPQGMLYGVKPAPPIPPQQGMYGVRPPPIPPQQGIYGVKPALPIPPPQGMYGVKPSPPIPPIQGLYGVKPAPPIPPPQGMYGAKPSPPIPPPQGMYGVRPSSIPPPQGMYGVGPLSQPADRYGNNSGQLHGGMQSMMQSNKSAASHRKMIHPRHRLASGMRPGMGAEKGHKIGSGRQPTMGSKQKKEHESSPSSKPSVNVQAAGLDLRALLARAHKIRAQEETK